MGVLGDKIGEEVAHIDP